MINDLLNDTAHDSRRKIVSEMRLIQEAREQTRRGSEMLRQFRSISGGRSISEVQAIAEQIRQHQSSGLSLVLGLQEKAEEVNRRIGGAWLSDVLSETKEMVKKILQDEENRRVRRTGGERVLFEMKVILADAQV